ncbi:MAG: RHS repeat-associated core domain-containing protein, partial [Tepidisphaeraceae bacterium]
MKVRARNNRDRPNGGTPVTRTHNAQNQIADVGGNGLDYDNNGNLTGPGATLTYDAWNRLVSFVTSGNIVATFSYDALRRRITEYVDSSNQTNSVQPIGEDPPPDLSTHFYYTASWQVIEERISGTAKTQYVWSRQYIDALVERDRDTNTNEEGLEERLYVQHDANFNTTALISDSGTVLQRYLYDPYGAPSFKSGSWGSSSAGTYGMKVLYQGLRYDATSNTVHARERDTSVGLGRPLQSDPAGYVDGMNRYEWVGSSPANFVDPLGLARQPAPIVDGSGGGWRPRNPDPGYAPAVQMPGLLTDPAQNGEPTILPHFFDPTKPAHAAAVELYGTMDLPELPPEMDFDAPPLD